MNKLLIKNVQALVADGSVQTVDIAIENEKIIKIGQISENLNNFGKFCSFFNDNK